MPLAPGQSLGRYQIAGPLDLEGVRELFRATDTLVGREVAIHVVERDVADGPGAERQFEREARAAVRLAHPNIVTEFDVGHEGPLWFVAMEPLAGETLAHRLARGPLRIGEALGIAAQLAAGLSYAHAVGVVHRGVSPGSVLLDRGRARLFDFVVIPSASHPHASAYSAPEILRGERPDYRADQYSLGVLLYEMLTGTRPSAGLAGVPPEIASIIVRCLAPRADQRFASTTDLAQAIETLRPWPDPAPKPAEPADAHPAPRVHPLRTALAVAVVVAIVALGAAGAWRLIRPHFGGVQPAVTRVADTVPTITR